MLILLLLGALKPSPYADLFVHFSYGLFWQMNASECMQEGAEGNVHSMLLAACHLVHIAVDSPFLHACLVLCILTCHWQSGAFEGIWVDAEGFVAEGSTMNVAVGACSVETPAAEIAASI